MEPEINDDHPAASSPDNAQQYGVTDLLSRYLASVQSADLPPEVIKESHRCFLNFVGCAIGGRSHEALRILDSTYSPFGGGNIAGIVGLQRRTDPLLAALLNGASATAHAFDDVHQHAVVHAGAPVCAAALALAQLEKSPGMELLKSIALGVEVTFRISQAISVPPAEGGITWYQTSIAGCVGAAVAAGHLLRLDEKQYSNAIGIVTGLASGSRVTHGSMTMLMLAGHAAQSGVRAALLAKQGFEGPTNSIEASYGFLELFSSKSNLAALTSGLGVRFEVLHNNYKSYPCGVVLHPVVDACLEVFSLESFNPEDVESVQLRMNPVALMLTNRPHPGTRSEGQVSAQHWAAAALLFGRAGILEGSPESIFNPSIGLMRDRIEIISDISLTKEQAQASVRLNSGACLVSRLHEGCLPMDDDTLQKKYRAQALQSFSQLQVTAQLAAIGRLPMAPSVDELAALF